MNSQNSAPLICCIIGIVVFIIAFVFSDPKTSTMTTAPITTYTSSYTTEKSIKTIQSAPPTWKCVDVTSYNKNPYDDNKCTSSDGQIRYVSDSESKKLDPTYAPSTKGASRYNK